jgi:NAD(P)-dependent dehydrogenase (short-subunit alcohol dehydrogenase family)
MSEERLKDKVAWISGAASGMGAAIAERFAAEGAQILAVDIQGEMGEALAARLRGRGGEAIFQQCDVAKSNEVERSIEAAITAFGGLDILVNCAGVVHVGLLHEYDEEDWDQLMGVNAKAIFLSVKHAVPHLTKKKRSWVVNIASASSFVGQAATPAYTASKHAALGLTRSIALDYAAQGMRCNCICPGITDTPMLRYHLNTTPDPEGTLAKRLQRVPMGVAIQPEDIARAALYFSSEDSAGITGTSLVVDGGWTACAEWETDGPTRFAEEDDVI